MPIYEFYCSKCQKEFELLRPIGQAAEPACCPACGTGGEKLMGAPAIRLASWIKPPSKAFRKRGGNKK
ncbi:MAG: zinc ribbon domain-containing protein [Chloroflexota bacterium]